MKNNTVRKSSYYVKILLGLIAFPVVVLLVAYGIMFWRKRANYPPPTVELFTTSSFSLTSISAVDSNQLIAPLKFVDLFSQKKIDSVAFVPLQGSEPITGFVNLQEALSEFGFTLSDLTFHFPISKKIPSVEKDGKENPTQISLFTNGLTFLKAKDQEIAQLPFTKWVLKQKDGCFSANTNHARPLVPPDSESAIAHAFLMDVAGRYVQIQMEEMRINRTTRPHPQFVISPIRCRFAIVDTQ